MRFLRGLKFKFKISAFSSLLLLAARNCPFQHFWTTNKIQRSIVHPLYAIQKVNRQFDDRAVHVENPHHQRVCSTLEKAYKN